MSRERRLGGINRKTKLDELAAIVSGALKREGIDVFLSGGAVVSIYSKNKYESMDLDFITYQDRKKIRKVMESLGFEQARSRHYTHPNTKYYVEFPGGDQTVGGELMEEFQEHKTKKGTVKILTPTYCVMDRLEAYYEADDDQSLEQAAMVAAAHPVNLPKIKKWSEFTRKSEKYGEFLAEMKRHKSAARKKG